MTAKSIHRHATVKLGDFTVPLLGIPTGATEEHCDGCGTAVHLSKMAVAYSGRFFCLDCRDSIPLPTCNTQP